MLFVFIFYTLFTFQFNFLVSLQKIIYWIVVISYLLLNFKYITSLLKKNKLQKSISLMLFFCAYSLYAILSFSLPILHGTYDFSYYVRILYFTLNILSFIAILIFINKNITSENEGLVFIQYFIKACLLYISISILFLLIPNARTLWLSLIYQPPRTELLEDFSLYVTRWGLAGFSGYQFTVKCTLAVIFQITLTNIYKVNIKNITVLILLFFGNVMYGRIGLTASFIAILGWILYSIIVMNRPKVLVYLFSIISLSILSLIYIYYTSDSFASTLTWAFTPFINLFTTGDLNNRSFDILVNRMYFLPSDLTLLFGDGRYTDSNGGYYMHTDAGFMRSMLYGGLLLQLFLYSSILFLLRALYKQFSQFNAKTALLQVLLFLVVFIILEFKGEMFFILIAALLPLTIAGKQKRLLKYD